MATLTAEKYEGPNVSIHDYDNHKYGSITFVCWALTPTGRRSKTHLEQYRLKQRGTLANAKPATLVAKAAEYFTDERNLPKLPKGYSWGKVYIQHDFLRETGG